MHRLMVYARRALLVLAGLIVGLIGVVIVFTNTNRFRVLLRDQVLSTLASTFKGRIGISAIEGSIWGNLTFRDLTLDYQGKRVLTAPRMDVGYALLPLIQGQVRVGSIALQDPTLTAVQEGDGTWNLLDAFQ